MDILNNTMTVEDFILLIGDDFPLLKQYKDTIQDPVWHAEGDVHIHTDMVLAETYELINTHDLDRKSAQVLVLAALFHDYGKPLSTKPVEIKGEEKIAAPHHEELGASRLLFCKPPFELSQSDWMRVLNLVAYHHIPKRLVVKDLGKNEYFKLTRRVKDIELLYLLEVADMKGRTCKDKDKQIEILEIFKMFCIEYQVWDQNPYAGCIGMVKEKFPDHANPEWIASQMASRFEDGQIHMLEEEIARAYQYKDSQCHLVIMCSLPGAGKSTLVKNDYKGYEVISLDEIRDEIAKCRSIQSLNDDVARVGHERLREALRARKNIVWDATTYRKDFRSKVAQLGFDYKAFVEIVFMHKPLDVIFAQNDSRKHAVPKEAMLSIIDAFQKPDIDECHELKIVM